VPSTNYWDLIEPYWDELPTDADPEPFLIAYGSLPVAVRHLLCAHWLQSEVCNGGFYQLFFNSTGILAPEAVDGFDAVGMPQTALLVKRAIALFGHAYPRDRVARIEFLEAAEGPGSLAEGVAALDEPFFKLIEKENGGWVAAADTYALGAG
jgi:hypothetical protein